jgi:MFS family permease
LGYVSGFFLLFILLVSRIINSAVGAASRPATGAYVADVTSLEERSSGMGKFGAANNIGTILGPILVGSIIGINIFNSKIEGFALLTPLIVMSFLMIVAIFFVLLFLPNKKSVGSDEVNSERPALDKNLKMLISIGVIVFTSFAIVQSVTAYYVQDRFSLTLDETARSTALLLGTMALMAIVSQLTFVQRFKGSPLELIKYSIPLFVLSSLIIVFSPSYTFIYFGMAIMGLAMGLASPGYTSAASLNADPNNQGAAVGLAMVAPGLGFTLGPFLSGLLYSISINLPFLFILPLFLVILFILPKLNSITTS